MRPFGAWFGRLAMAGACLAWAGCGRGDIPDPDSDSSAAAESAPRVVDRGGQAVADPEPPAAPAGPAAPEGPTRAAPPAANNPEVAQAPAPAPAAEAPAEAEKAAPAVKGDASGTEEMLRMASAPASPSPTSDTPSAPGTTPGATPGGPGDRGDPNRTGGGPTPGGPTPGGGPASIAPAQEPPGGAAGPGYGPGSGRIPGATTVDNAGGPGAMAGPGAIGGPGSVGGPGSATDSADFAPGTFRRPDTAAAAFLSALKSKNKDRLSQATARRAATEAVEKHRKIFAAIIEQSISDDELDDMAKAMDGFQIISMLEAKSTGRIGVLVGKMEGRDRLQRTLTVRHEKEGWKVMDISDMYDFKPGLPPMFMRGGRRR